VPGMCVLGVTGARSFVLDAASAAYSVHSLSRLQPNSGLTEFGQS
jgi:hypothetical protein